MTPSGQQQAMRDTATAICRLNGSLLTVRRKGAPDRLTHGYYADVHLAADDGATRVAEGEIVMHVAAVTRDDEELDLTRGDRIVIRSRAWYVQDPAPQGAPDFPKAYMPRLGRKPPR